MAKNSGSSNGIGFFTILFLIFMTLKLTGYINWSWWFVTMPLWGGFVLIGVVFVLVFLFLNIRK